jgi:hypothetical protein
MGKGGTFFRTVPLPPRAPNARRARVSRRRALQGKRTTGSGATACSTGREAKNGAPPRKATARGVGWQGAGLQGCLPRAADPLLALGRADGTTYVGRYREDKRSGHGVGKWPSGIVYDGRWLDNQFHGEGKLTWPRGCKVPGSYFVAVDREGNEVGRPPCAPRPASVSAPPPARRQPARQRLGGRVLCAAARRGAARAGAEAGRAERRAQSFVRGKVYQGRFVEGLKDGRGVLLFWDGSNYVGNFAKDTFEGRGVLKYENGDVYDGGWSGGVFDGLGKFAKGDGTETYSGEFCQAPTRPSARPLRRGGTGGAAARRGAAPCAPAPRCARRQPPAGPCGRAARPRARAPMRSNAHALAARARAAGRARGARHADLRQRGVV